ncbi:MAG: dihydroorotase [Clostridiales bacterium]|jgi:dihydroorotase|nr:dihydroorotase [Clostridiales bacterium]
MKCLLKNANVFWGEAFERKDILIEDGVITDIKSYIPLISDASVYDMNKCFIFPGLIDVHVHLREPGFSYKETIASGSIAAARGGYTTVCAMPNLDPVPDSLEHLSAELEIIKKDAKIHVLPYASITVGEKQKELSDMDKLAKQVVAFSDDGVGVQDADMMEKAMRKAKALNKIIAAHCEVNDLLNGGCIHDGEYARLNSFKGISSESEWREVERDIELVRRTGCNYHVCHVSTKESVSLIRRAKAEGLPISCETAPHYLVLCDMDMSDDGRFKMNPPLRSAEDRQALIEGIKDGTIDMIATDHAPHSAEEKSGGLRNSLNGIVGLETAFPILYTRLVKTGEISLEKLIELMQVNPAKRFGIGSSLKVGEPADLTVFDLNEEYAIDPKDFLSKGRATPFEGERVFGKCKLTMIGGIPVWEDLR